MNTLDKTALQILTTLVIVLALKVDAIVAFLANAGLITQIAIPTVTFVLIYQVLVHIYDAMLWPYVHRHNYIGGKWIYALHNHVTDKHLYGVFVVRQGLDGTQITEGAVWFTGALPAEPDAQRGAWQSTIAAVRDDELQFVFLMKTLALPALAGAGADVQGIMFLNLCRDDRSPTGLSGRFYDHRDRAGMYGSVIAEKINARNRKQHIEHAYQRFGTVAQTPARVTRAPSGGTQ